MITLRRFALFCMISAAAAAGFLSLTPTPAHSYEGEDLGYIDAVTVNGRHFEDLDENRIVFYPEDLEDGEVTIRGLLEEESDIPIDRLKVEVTFDGGDTWQSTRGGASWQAAFRPEPEQEYQFSVRVVCREKEQKETPAEDPVQGIFKLAIGEFTLMAKGEIKNGSLSGTGIVNLGYLNHYLPKALFSAQGRSNNNPKDKLTTAAALSPTPGSQGVNMAQGVPVDFAGLKLDSKKTRVVNGSVTINAPCNVDIIGNSTLMVRSLNLSPDKAELSGRLSYSGDIRLPPVPVHGFSFSPSGIRGKIVYHPRRPLGIPLINGPYSVSLKLKKIAFNIDTATPSIDIADMNLSLAFSDAYGKVKAQTVSFAGGLYQWGSRAPGNAGAELKIPGTAIRLKNIGGTIEKGFGGLTLAGQISIPSPGGPPLDIDLQKYSGLKINERGISTLKQIALNNPGKTFSLGGFDSSLSALALSITHNRISGRLLGKLKLASLGNAGLSYGADIGPMGIHSVAADISGKAKTLSIPSFGDITLSGAQLSYGRGGSLKVSLDGGVAITNPALKSFVRDPAGAGRIKEQGYFSQLGKTSFSKDLGRAGESGRTNLKTGIDTAENMAARGGDFVFNSLEIAKTSVKLPENLTGWHSLSSPMTASIESMNLSLDGWGMGTDGKGFWAGIKGSADVGDSTVSGRAGASVKFYADGSYTLLDFQANTTITMGDFILYTDAAVTGGRVTGYNLSGSGRLVSTFSLPSLPDALKNASGQMDLEILFSDLEIDPDNLKVLAGAIEVPVEFTLPFDMADIRFSKLSFSPESALAQAKVYLKGMEGIEGFSLENISLSENGFSASAAYRPSTPLSYTFFDAPYDFTCVFKSIGVSFSTAPMAFDITALDAHMVTGTGFDSVRFDLGVKDNLFAWGSALENDAHTAHGAVQGARLAIPGGMAFIENPGGLISLANRQCLDLHGKIVLPGFEDLALDIPEAHPLSISQKGISTSADIILDSLAGQVRLEGFPATLKQFSLNISENNIDAAFAAGIRLENFGNITIDLKGVVGNQGIKSIGIDAGMPQLTASIEDFADLSISNLGAGYGEKGFYVHFDSDIRITNPALAGETARALSLRHLNIYKDAIDLPQDLEGWHSLTPPFVASISGLDLALTEWGAGTEGNKLWVGLKGEGEGNAGGKGRAAVANASAAVTAQLFTDGTVRVMDFDFSGSFALGPFKLLTDATISGGKLSGSGTLVTEAPLSREVAAYLPANLIDPQTQALNAVVSFRDLVINEAERMITGGAIDLVQDFSFTVDDILDLNISKLSFSTQGMGLTGTMDIPALGAMVSVPGVAFSNLALGLEGLSGTTALTASWPTPFRLDLIDNLGICLQLNSLGVGIDWDRSGTDKLSLNTISGYLDFGTLFERTDALKNQVLTFVDNQLTVAIPELKIPGTDIALETLAAKLDITGSLPRINFDRAELNIPFYDEVVKIAGTGVKIDSSGFSGIFSMASQGLALNSFGFNARLKQLVVEFDNTMVTAGAFDLGLRVDKFFSLAFDVQGRVAMDGIRDLSLGMETADIPKVDAYGIADISLNSLAVGYQSGEGVFLNLEPVIDIKSDLLSSLDDFTMKNVKVYKNRVSATGGSISQSLDNMDFELGPAEVALSRIGLALSDTDLEFTLEGKLKLADLCSAGAAITLNKAGISLDGIELSYEKPGINLGGLLEWEDGHFRSAVTMGVADFFTFDGDFTIGRSHGQGAAFTYWRVAINAPAAIPLPGLPVSLYKVGGGLAYHMKAESGSSPSAPVAFTPDSGTPFLFMAATQLGTTSDNGYAWHGDFSLIINPVNFYIRFDGDSYVMCTKEESPASRRLSASIEMGASPALFHLSAEACLEQKKGSVQLFKVAGMFDILFSESDWHIHVGTKENKLSVSAVNEIFSGAGYVMIDSSGLMMGVSKSFDLKASVACFYGRLYGGAAFDMVASVRPFFVDAEGRIWVGIEAGVKAFGEKFEIFGAYGSLAMNIRCPDPTYVRVKAKFKYSFMGGWVSGSYKMTFWMPEKPQEAKSDQISFPLISFLSPENNGSNVSRITKIELNTALPIDEVIRLDNGNMYVLRIVDWETPSTTEMLGIPSYINIHDDANINHAIVIKDAAGQRVSRVVGGVLDVDTIKLQAFDQLKRNQEYTIKSGAHLIRLQDTVRPGAIDFKNTPLQSVIDRVEYQEPPIVNRFRTADTEDLATAREIIEAVYPNYNTPLVYPDTEVRVTYRVPAGGQAISLRNKHYLLDPLKRVAVSPDQWRQGLGTVDDIMATEQWVKFAKPASPLNPVVVWVDKETGEKRAPLMVNGQAVNPFLNDQPQATAGTQTGSVGFSDASTTVENTGSGGSNLYQVSDGIGQTQVGASQPSYVLMDRYERKELTAYSLVIKDPAGEKIVYQSRFNVTPFQNGSGAGNADIIGALAQDGSTEGSDPFNIVMLINSFYQEDTQALADYDQQVENYKQELLSRFMGGQFGQGGPDCLPRAALPPESAHYYDGDLEDHMAAHQQCYQTGRGSFCNPPTYTYDYGYEPPPDSIVPYFDEMMYCPTFLEAFELWKMNNPKPRDYHAYGAPEDIMFYFDTDNPLNWDAVNMKFEIAFNDFWDNTSQQWLKIGSYTVDRNDYSVLSQPESLQHVIRIPLASVMPQDRALNYMKMAGSRNNSGTLGWANVSLWAVESYQAPDGSISTRAASQLNSWRFTHKPGQTGPGYPCQSCQSYGYGASYCTDTTCYNLTDPHFVLEGSEK